MTHPTEDTLAAYVAGLLTETQSRELADHLATCAACDGAARDYREITAALREWRDAPEPVVERIQDLLVQRMRLHRLFHRMFADQDLRRRLADDPARELAAHGIAPTPAVLAAFKELGPAGPERFPGELDERLSKFRRIIEWFPGAPWH
jgi:anti-sigma factor RsiW